jgi:hypothetical protein
MASRQMDRQLQQAGPLLDLSVSEDESSDGTPSTAPNESSIPAVQARNGFLRVVHAFGQDRKR